MTPATDVTTTRRTTRAGGAVLATGLGVALLLAGCSSGDDASGAAPATTAPASPSGSASQGSPTSSPSGSASPSDGGEDRMRRCTVDDLDVGAEVPEGSGAAGSRVLLLTFRDTSDHSCVLAGFPGVSFVGDRDGTQLGAAAERSGEERSVTLSPGRTTSAVLRVADAGNYPEGTCAPQTADGLRVYPPGSREAAYVAYEVRACTGSTDDSPQLVVQSVGTSR